MIQPYEGKITEPQLKLIEQIFRSDMILGDEIPTGLQQLSCLEAHFVIDETIKRIRERR